MFLLLPLPCCYEPWEEDFPKTEDGKDVFDINVNYEKFSESSIYETSSFVVENGNICFSLHGEMGGHNRWEGKKERRTLSFIFPLDSMKINDFNDVTVLDSFALDFSKKNALVVWEQGIHADTLNVKSGLLKFTYARLIGIDGERNTVILSGDIDLSYEDTTAQKDSVVKKWPEAKRIDGWFDVVIRPGNFENRK